MKSAVLFLLSTILTVGCLGQQIDHDAKTIRKIFRANANGTTFNWKKKNWDNGSNNMHLNLYATWITCDNDSSYFRSDTVVLYNHNLAYLDFDCCCQLMEWWMRKGMKMHYVKSTPPMSSVAVGLWDLKVVDDTNGTRIDIQSGNEVRESFQVISLQKTLNERQHDQMYILTLKRNN